MSASRVQHGTANDHGINLREVGKPITRLDGPLKVMGKARFAAEVPFENLTYAALVCSTIARGKIAAIDTSAAEASPGVVLVMTYKNAPRLADPPLLMTAPDAAGASDLPVMQNASIHWNGEPVAVVLGNTQEQADHAASLIEVRYETQHSETVFEAGKPKARMLPNLLGQPTEIAIGDAEDALRQSRFAVDHVYHTPRHHHAAIELHAATVAWEDGTLVVHDTTQMIHLTRGTLAKIFKIPADKVRVLSPFVGGGFGGKGLWSHQILAAAASKLSKRPVRMVLSREGVFRAVGGRTLTEQRVALGSDGEGPLAALIHTGYTSMTRHNNVPEQFTFPARLLYAAKNIWVKQQVVDLDQVANTFMRAPGESVGTFALESAIDELAIKMAIDPIELRRRIEPDRNPTDGRAYSDRHLMEAYRTGADRFGWRERSAQPGQRREGDWLIGFGTATGTYPYHRMPGGRAGIRIDNNGQATVRMGSHEMGMGTATVQAQAAADRLGLPLEKVRFEYGDSAMPSGTIAGGSSQTATIIAAVAAASDRLRSELLKLAGNASPLSGLGPDEVVFRDGGLGARDDPQRQESYVTIIGRAGRSEIEVEADAPPPAEMQQFSMHSYSALFCEVWVNAVTGETRVKRVLGSFDCGRILNPKTATSQFRGGIIMGIGLALTEEAQFDERTGRFVNASLAEYHVPVHLDVPEIDVVWTGIPDPQSPMGARGIGEIGITGVAAAIANAVYNATGKRIRDLPITLDKLL
jgi:xanthine dehydrogenase YagR molybdenum-binding subunit